MIAPQELGTETTRVVAMPETFAFSMERVFDAPRELVWQALTDPERLKQWWGPRRYALEVPQHDLRVGGTYRYIQTAEDGGQHPFRGEFLEIDPPSKMVSTFIYDVPIIRDSVAVTTLELFDEGDGRTRLRGTTRFPDAMAYEGALGSGMIPGAIETWDRLDEVVAGLR